MQNESPSGPKSSSKISEKAIWRRQKHNSGSDQVCPRFWIDFWGHESFQSVLNRSKFINLEMQVSDSISTLLSELIGGPTSSKCSCWAFPENGQNVTLVFETQITKNVSFLTSFSMHKLTTKWLLGPTTTPRVFRAWKTKLPATIWHEFNKFGHWFLLTCRHAVTKTTCSTIFSSDWIRKSTNTPADRIQFALSRKNNTSTCMLAAWIGAFRLTHDVSGPAECAERLIISVHFFGWTGTGETEEPSKMIKKSKS